LQRLLPDPGEERNDSLLTRTSPRFAHDLRRIPVYPAAGNIIQSKVRSTDGGAGAATTDTEAALEQPRPWSPSISDRIVSMPIPPAPTVSHHSPPKTGAGSRRSPKVPAAHPLAVSAMNADTWYRSPSNTENPVVAWTDGRKIFLSPSQKQIDAKRRTASPEAVLNVPAGYTATELRWDQSKAGILIGKAVLLRAAPLVVLVQKKGADDQLITVSTTLEQKLSFMSLGGATHGGTIVTMRSGTEMLLVNDERVALEISGATAKGPIHAVKLRGGFIRYHAGGTHDLYMSRSGATAVYLVERSSGAIDGRFSGKTIDAVLAKTDGKVDVEEKGATAADNKTHTVDLKTSPPTVTVARGLTSGGTAYQKERAKVEAHGVKITEKGARLGVEDLVEIDKILTERGRAAGFVNAKAALVAYRDRNKAKSQDPILLLEKSVGVEDARADIPSNGSTPRLSIREPFEATSLNRSATVRHEMTHIVTGVKDKLSPGKIPARLEAIYKILSKTTYSFLADVEGTGSKLGTELADESRYSRAGDTSVGHPETSVSEFTASFVTCATLFWPSLIVAITDAQKAGDRGGGTKGTDLLKLYQEAWDLIDANYMPLGPRMY
jgi:hypothetical protein